MDFQRNAVKLERTRARFMAARVYMKMLFIWTVLCCVGLSNLAYSQQSIKPMGLEKRKGIVERHGFCSIRPSRRSQDDLMTGNGVMRIMASGHPLRERIVFNHERLYIPQWKKPPEPPEIAHVLDEVRELILDGKYSQATALGIQASIEAGLPAWKRGTNETHPAFAMWIELDEDGQITDYLRTEDFRTGEIKVYWTDNRGQWVRRAFVSRADNVVVQELRAPEGTSLNAKILIDEEASGLPGGMIVKTHFNKEELAFTAEYQRADISSSEWTPPLYLPEVGNKGYASVTRVKLERGSSKIVNRALEISDARSVLLLTRVERYEDFNPDKYHHLRNEVAGIEGDYEQLLERHAAIHRTWFDRVSLDLGAGESHLLSAEELQIEQLKHPSLHPALLEKMFDMGRFFLIIHSGELPPIYGHVNLNVNEQVSSGNIGNLPEAMESYFNWIESILEDSRLNAHNIMGCRGILVAAHPDGESGYLYHFAFDPTIDGGNTYPNWPHHYWISAAGWVYNPFYEHYLVTGDKEFLRKRLIPGLKEIALFYEDFLTKYDEDANYIFVPSYSPENNPANLTTATVINATMDISVCREVLTNLIRLCKEINIETENIPKWQRILDKLPDYLFDEHGGLKEWAWPTLEERFNHRHISHLYGVWPGDEINFEDTPELAEAALIALRKRGDKEYEFGGGVTHKALAAARLKDSDLVFINLKQVFDQGYINTNLTTNDAPHAGPYPDVLGSIPTLLMESILCSRPGVIELLPAVDGFMEKGTISGMCARTQVKVDKLEWDLESGEIQVSLTSLIDQELTLIQRKGISSMKAPEGVIVEPPRDGGISCTIKLPAQKPVTLYVRITG